MAAKPWDVLPECANLDATLHGLAMMIDDGEDRSVTHGASSTSRTILGSNDIDLAMVGDEDPIFFKNPYDYDY